MIEATVEGDGVATKSHQEQGVGGCKRLEDELYTDTLHFSWPSWY